MISKKLSKAQQIRNLLAEGKTPAQIAATLGTTLSYIYVVKYETKKKAAPPKRGPGRPKGSKNKKKKTVKPAPAVVTAPAVQMSLIPAAPLGLMARLRVLFTGRV